MAKNQSANYFNWFWVLLHNHLVVHGHLGPHFGHVIPNAILESRVWSVLLHVSGYDLCEVIFLGCDPLSQAMDSVLQSFQCEHSIPN